MLGYAPLSERKIREGVRRLRRVLAEPAVVGPTRRLHIGHAPRLGTEHAEEGFRMRRPGADLEVERLLQQAPVRGPVRGQLEDEVLEGHA